MRWFKHISLTRTDPKMRLLIAEFGYEGYGVYWTILEKIAENMTPSNNLTEATMSTRQWANSGKISAKKTQKIIKFCSEMNFFSSQTSGSLTTINCPKLLKYRDEYSRKRK